ncbi:MAG: phage portal protein, partial [Aestuariivirga sp.]
MMTFIRRMLGRAPAAAKDIEPWRAGMASTENADNFVTNQVTLANYRDFHGLHHSAIGLSATYACVNLIAGTIASLPLMVYRRNADGVRDVARDHPLYQLLHDSPNYDQTALDFWEFMAASLELHGNAYAIIERGSAARVAALIPLRPDKVTARRNRAGDIDYEWHEDGRRFV